MGQRVDSVRIVHDAVPLVGQEFQQNQVAGTVLNQFVEGTLRLVHLVVGQEQIGQVPPDVAVVRVIDVAGA